MRFLLLLLVLSPCACWAQREVAAQLLRIRRIHVEKLSGGETAVQIRDMLIAYFQRTRLFVLTENPDNADAFLRGSAEDLIYTDLHDNKEGVDARGSVSLGTKRQSSSRYNKGPSFSTSIGQSESSREEERKHEAMAAVRLVNKDGDVIWSTVQESDGTKFHGASVDVVKSITRQLLTDYKRLEKQVFQP